MPLPLWLFKKFVPTKVRALIPLSFKLKAERAYYSVLVGNPDEFFMSNRGVTGFGDLHSEYVLCRVLLGAQQNSHNVLKRVRQTDRRYDLVIAHELLDSGLAGIETRKVMPNCKLILDNVEYPRLSGRSGGARFDAARSDPIADNLISSFVAAVANGFDQIITTSRGQADALTEMGVNAPVTVVRNARFHSVTHQAPGKSGRIRQRAGCEPGDVLILYSNHIYRNGGAEEFLLAMKHLPPNYRAAFLGEFRANLNPAIEAILEKYSLRDRVAFLEPVKPGEIIDFISGADAIIVPLKPDFANHMHCLPNRVFEALNARVPIVAFEGSEIGEFVTSHGIGQTFSSFGERDMARAIQSTAEHNQQGGFDLALSEAHDKVCWENEARKFEDVLDSLELDKDANCLIVACKVLDRNDRIFRLCSTLTARGISVDVFSFTMPMPELIVPGVQYHLIR